MDERGLKFIQSLIVGHIDSALRGQPTSHSGRGASLFDLHDRVIKRLFGNGWGVGHLLGEGVIHQKWVGVLDNRSSAMISESGGPL